MADTARRAELQRGIENHEIQSRKARVAWKATRSAWQAIEAEHEGNPSADVIAAHEKEELAAEGLYRDAKKERKRAETKTPPGTKTVRG